MTIRQSTSVPKGLKSQTWQGTVQLTAVGRSLRAVLGGEVILQSSIIVWKEQWKNILPLFLSKRKNWKTIVGVWMYESAC